jgi:hypothetical protein
VAVPVHDEPFHVLPCGQRFQQVVAPGSRTSSAAQQFPGLVVCHVEVAPLQ